MSRNIQEIPFTELQERAKKIARTAKNTKDKIRGALNDVYVSEIPSKFDWDFLITESSLTTIAKHNIGTVSINTGTTSLTFSSDAALTSSMTNRKINIFGNDFAYDFTFTDSTGGTLNPSFEGPANASNNGYEIYQNRYSLPATFDRFPMDGGLYKLSGGKKEIVVPFDSYQSSAELGNLNPGMPKSMRLVEPDTAGCVQVELDPPSNQTRNLGYDYLRTLVPMSESTAGTATIAAAGSSLTGSNTKFTEMTTGDWIRFDALGIAEDSQWYKIINIIDDTGLTIRGTFANTSMTNANYAISSAPQYPVRMHLAVLFGAIRALDLDQTDESFQVYNIKMAEILTDSKRIHVTRKFTTEIDGYQEDFLYRR